MRRVFGTFAMVVAITACASQTAAQVPRGSGDARILMAVTDSLIVCEGQTAFPKIEVAWKSGEPEPSDGPPDISWSAAADSIASVKSNSQVTGRKAGVTHIIATVQWGAVSASKPFPVTVLQGRHDAAASKAQGRLVCKQ